MKDSIEIVAVVIMYIVFFICALKLAIVFDKWWLFPLALVLAPKYTSSTKDNDKEGK